MERATGNDFENTYENLRQCPSDRNRIILIVISSVVVRGIVFLRKYGISGHTTSVIQPRGGVGEREEQFCLVESLLAPVRS